MRSYTAVEAATVAYMARVEGKTWAEAAEVAGFENEAEARAAIKAAFGSILPPPDRGASDE